MILLILAVAASQPGTSPEERAYFDCVETEAKRLTPSGESAPVIASVTQVLCSNQLEPALREFHISRSALLKSRGVSGTLAESRDLLLKAASESAVAFVVEERAKANANQK